MQNIGMTGQLEADDFDEEDCVCSNPEGPDTVKRCISFETAAAEEARTNKRMCGASSPAGNTEVGCRTSSKEDNCGGRTERRAECQWGTRAAPEAKELRRLKCRQPDGTSDHIYRCSGGYWPSSEEGFEAASRHLLGRVGRLSTEKKTKIQTRNETSNFLSPRSANNWNETSTFSSPMGGAQNWNETSTFSSPMGEAKNWNETSTFSSPMGGAKNWNETSTFSSPMGGAKNWNETSTFSSPRGGAKNWQDCADGKNWECLARSNESLNVCGAYPGIPTPKKNNITSDMIDGGTNKENLEMSVSSKGGSLQRLGRGNKLFQAVVRNDLDQVRQLCVHKRWKRFLNRIDNSGNTALMLAAEIGLLEMAKLLVELGADPELRNDWGETALYVASVSGQLSESALIVHHLVRTAPSTLNVAANNGHTPIFAVAGRCQTETTELVLGELIRAGADLNRGGRDEDVYRGRPMTPFELAVTLGNFVHAEMLYEAGCYFLPVLSRYKQLNCYPDSLKTHPIWYNKIRSWTANPKSLKDICGLKIKNCLGGGNPGQLLTVLPSSMVNYLNALSIQS